MDDLMIIYGVTIWNISEGEPPQVVEYYENKNDALLKLAKIIENQTYFREYYYQIPEDKLQENDVIRYAQDSTENFVKRYIYVQRITVK